MMAQSFQGRDNELRLLDKLWQSQRAELLVLSGRRKIGKTALLSAWLQRTSPRAIYWGAYATSSKAQLRAFSQAIYNFAHPGHPASTDFTYESWQRAFTEVASLAKHRRLALLLDGFTHLLEADAGIASQLQILWDQLLSKRNLFLCFAGVQPGVTKRELLSHQAVLYGQASSHLHLKPFSYGETHRFFPNYSAIDRVTIYAIFGGVPAYWQYFDPQLDVNQNIQHVLLAPDTLLQAEPRLLLQDFVSDAHNYNAIVAAVANGAHTVKDIAASTGLPSGHVTKYLSVLTESGFIERRTPVTEDKPSHSGRYHITDPYLRFYFRFLSDKQDQLALGMKDIVLAQIKTHLPKFIAQYTWPELCREWTVHASEAGELPFMADVVGGAWNADIHIDVVGINSTDKTLIQGDCLWTSSVTGPEHIEKLIKEKTAKFIPHESKWRVFIIGFSSGGWTEKANRYQEQVNHQPIVGANWQSSGMRLVNLNQIDQDLRRMAGTNLVGTGYAIG